MNNKKICVFLCCLNLLNKYSYGATEIINQNNIYQVSNRENITKKLISHGIRDSAIVATVYSGLKQITRFGINTGNLTTQKVINLFKKNKNSKNWANIPTSQYDHPSIGGSKCTGKFWSEQKLKTGGRIIIYSPEISHVKKVWICFAGCSSYGLDALKDFWISHASPDESRTAFVAIDYPGYGTESPGGTMSKNSLQKISAEVVEKVSEIFDSDYRTVEKCVWGHSLGTFPASWTLGDERIKEIYLHSPVDLRKIPDSILGTFLVFLNGENLNSIDNLLKQGKKRKTTCKITIVSGGRKKNEPGDGPYEFLCLENTLLPTDGKKLKKLVDDGKLNIICKIKKSAGHCDMFKIDDIEAKNYNYVTGKIEEES